MREQKNAVFTVRCTCFYWQTSSIESNFQEHFDFGPEKWCMAVEDFCSEDRTHQRITQSHVERQRDHLCFADPQFQTGLQNFLFEHNVRVSDPPSRVWLSYFSKQTVDFIKAQNSLAAAVELVGSWTVNVGDQDQALHLWKFTGGYEKIDLYNDITSKSPVSCI